MKVRDSKDESQTFMACIFLSATVRNSMEPMDDNFDHSYLSLKIVEI